MTAHKVRLRFAKHGDLRLISHHDLMRCVERALRRAEIPVAVSQGFNPRPKVVFAQALALGIEGHREIVEMDLAEPMAPAEVLGRLAATAPPGLDWLDAEAAPPGRPPRAETLHYAIEIPEDRHEAARAAIDALLADSRRLYTRHRPDRDVALDLRPFVLGAELAPSGTLRFRLKMTPDGSARPEEVLDTLGLRDLLGQGAVLVRTEMELASDSQGGPGDSGP